MKRPRRAELPPPVVSVVAVVDELIRSHRFFDDEGARAQHATRVRAAAAGLGVRLGADWLPSMSPEQAQRVLNAIVAERDPLDVAMEREAAAADEWLASGKLRAAEMVKFFGANLVDRPVPYGEARGPADPPGPLETAAEQAYQARVNAGPFAAQVFPGD